MTFHSTKSTIQAFSPSVFIFTVPSELVEKLVWVPVILLCKIFILSYMFDVLLCRNWPSSPPNRETLNSSIWWNIILSGICFMLHVGDEIHLVFVLVGSGSPHNSTHAILIMGVQIPYFNPLEWFKKSWTLFSVEMRWFLPTENHWAKRERERE
jgi:hypothetical protein